MVSMRGPKMLLVISRRRVSPQSPTRASGAREVFCQRTATRIRVRIDHATVPAFCIRIPGQTRVVAQLDRVLKGERVWLHTPAEVPGIAQHDKGGGGEGSECVDVRAREESNEEKKDVAPPSGRVPERHVRDKAMRDEAEAHIQLHGRQRPLAHAHGGLETEERHKRQVLAARAVQDGDRLGVADVKGKRRDAPHEQADERGEHPKGEEGEEGWHEDQED